MQNLFLHYIVPLVKLNLMSVTKAIYWNNIKKIVVLFFIEPDEIHKYITVELLKFKADVTYINTTLRLMKLISRKWFINNWIPSLKLNGYFDTITYLRTLHKLQINMQLD